MLTVLFFFFNDTATTEIYTLSLRRSSDLGALQFLGTGGERVFVTRRRAIGGHARSFVRETCGDHGLAASSSAAFHDSIVKCTDRKSTRLNSSHSQISYAAFCLKKKKHSKLKPTPKPSPPRPQSTPAVSAAI